jgi:hypothetical protein
MADGTEPVDEHARLLQHVGVGLERFGHRLELLAVVDEVAEGMTPASVE